MAFGKLVVNLMLKDKGFQDGLKKAGVSTKQFEGGALGLAKSISGTLVTAMKAGTVAVAAFGAASAKVGTDFQHSITLVKSLSKDGIQNFKALEDEARRLGATTEFSARQSAEAMVNFARAGMKSRDIIAATGPALMMAGGAGESMSLATMTMAASLRQFSLDATDSQHVADVFTVALKNSLFNLQGLNDAMKYAGPAGAVFGMTIEETTAAVAQFRNMGLDASMAGTAFRMSLVALAKRTPAMTKVMDKYGLKVADVSLESNTFQQVLQNLAGTAITAEDAIKMFGARAGANMGLLIDQMRDPEFVTGFDDLTTSLYESSAGAGAAAIQYAEMGKTVKRQFLIAKSAAEELLLSVWDNYKGPLMEMFRELGIIIQFTADAFKSIGSSFASGLTDPITATTRYLKENKIEIAGFFLELHQFVSQVMGILTTVVPILVDMMQILAKMWPIALVVAFSAAIAKLPMLFALAATGARALGLAMSTAMGPWGIAITAIATIATVIYQFSDAASGGDVAARAYAKGLESMTKEQKKVYEATKKSTGAILEQQVANWEAHEKWMTAQGFTLKQIEQYRQKLAALTGASVLAQAAQGSLVEVTVDGAKAFHTVDMAAKMLGEGGLAEVRKAYDEQWAVHNKTNDLYNEQLLLVAKLEAALSAEEQEWGLVSTLDLMRAAIAGATGKLDGLSKEWANTAKNTKGAEKALNSYRLELKGFLDMSPAGYEGENKKKKGRGSDPRKAMRKAILEQEKKLQEDLAKVGLDADQLQLYNLKQQQQKITEMYEALIAKEKSRRKKKDLEVRQAAALVLAEEIFLLKGAEKEKEAAAKRGEANQQARAKLLLDNEHIFQGEMFQAEAEARRARNEMLFDIERHGIIATAEERKRIDAETQAAITAGAIADLRQRMKAEDRIFTTVGERMAIHRASVSVSQEQEVEEGKAEVRAKFARMRISSESLTAVAVGAVAGKLRDELENESRVYYQNKLKKQIKAAEDGVRAAGKVRQAALDEEEQAALAAVLPRETKLNANRLKIEAALQATRLDKLRDLAHAALSGDEGEPDKEPLIQSLLGLNDKEMEKLQAKIQLVKDLVEAAFIAPAQKAIGLFKEITGFSWNMSGMMGDAGDMKGEMGDAAVDAEAARREKLGMEPMNAKQEAAAREEGEGGYDPATAAKGVADEQVQGMMDQIQMWLDMAPALMTKLAENLPTLIDAFVVALPELVKGFVAAMTGPDGIIMAVIKGVPKLLRALVKQLPRLLRMVVFGLIQFLKKGIPKIFSAIMTALPMVVMAIAKAIPKIFDAIFIMLPKILDAFIAMIPDLLAALVTLVVNLVGQLVVIIPRLLAVVIGMIGPIFVAAAHLIPTLITAVIDLIPELIMSLIIAIPEIVFAIIKSVPMIVMAFITAIPLIISSLIHALPKLWKELTTKLPRMVGKSISGGFGRAWDAIKKSISDFISGLNPFKSDKKWKDSKINPKNWFNDTPGAIRVKRGGGTTLGFAGGDYVAAAQKPIDMLAQAMEAVRSDPKSGVPSMGMNRQRQQAMMASPVPLGAAMGGAGGGGAKTDIALKVQVEGQTIDNALITSRGRGNSPKMWKEIRRLSGVTSGFDRK